MLRDASQRGKPVQTTDDDRRCDAPQHEDRETASQGAKPRLAIDVGGTFTDVVVEAAGERWTTKVLTTPEAPELGV